MPRREFGHALLSWLDSYGSYADGVELKLLLATPAIIAARSLTGRAAPRWRTRRHYLIDTPGLDLARAGVEIRLRRRARGRHDLAVRARRVGARGWRPTPRDARIELDVLPDALVETVEVGRELDADRVGDVVDGSTTPAALLSPTQRAWVSLGARDHVDPALLDDLRVHGPLLVQRLKIPAAHHGGLRPARLEYCRYPSGRELVELSARCRPLEASGTAAELENLIEGRGLTAAAVHRTKSSVWRDEIADGVPVQRRPE